MRIVITGIGIITAIASNYKELLNSFQKCEHGIRKVNLFNTNNDFPVASIPKKIDQNFPFRTLNIADIALKEAIADSNLDLNSRFCFSSSTIGMPELEDTFLALAKKESVHFDYSKALSVGAFAQKLAHKNNIKGTITSFSTACSSSSNALCYGFLQIKQNVCDSVIVGGADALCRLTYHGFQSLRIMSPSASAPFDASRQGMNLGEGAGFIVLESLVSAKKRGAKIYAEVLGTGMSADGYHMSSPAPEGIGAQMAMMKALRQSSLSPQQIEYISAHGTGTIPNDTTESIAIEHVFGNHTPNIYVNAIKSYLGHTLGAAGIIAVISAICSIKNSFIPPILGLKQLAPESSFRAPDAKGTHCQIQHALVNAFAFGGNNTSIILGKYDDE